MNTLVIREREGRAPRHTVKKFLIVLAVLAIVVGLAFLFMPQSAHAGSLVGSRLAARETARHDKAAGDPAPAPPGPGEGTVNLNTASEDDLMLLPGVGPSKAQAIIAYRKKFGIFKKIEDLGKVKGFGYKTLRRLRSHLAVSGSTTFVSPASKGTPGSTRQVQGPGLPAPGQAGHPGQATPGQAGAAASRASH
jgi:competence protein ComEA